MAVVHQQKKKNENPILQTNFHYGCNSNFNTYKASAPCPICSSFAADSTSAKGTDSAIPNRLADVVIQAQCSIVLC